MYAITNLAAVAMPKSDKSSIPVPCKDPNQDLLLLLLRYFLHLGIEDELALPVSVVLALYLNRAQCPSITGRIRRNHWHISQASLNQEGRYAYTSLGRATGSSLSFWTSTG